MSTIDFSGFAGVVAGNVRAEAVRAGFTQTRLAKELGMSQSYLSKKWRGVILWGLDELEPVAKALHVPLERLLDWTARPEGVEPPTF